MTQKDKSRSIANFWNGKKVLITGHTGFKGSWLTAWLEICGAQVFGVSLDNTDFPNLFCEAEIEKLCKSFILDIRDFDQLFEFIHARTFDCIFHMAAQPLVIEGYKSPRDTYTTNVIGTLNLLECLRLTESTSTLIIVTTDKVYEDKEWISPYRETDRLGGKDPYSCSKAMTELLVASHRDSYSESLVGPISCARAGNVIGGGDWAANRLIPDVIRAWQAQTPVCIRNPKSTRPWQHVLDALYGYILLAQKSMSSPSIASSFNFGPNTGDILSVKEVTDECRNHLPDLNIDFSSKTNHFVESFNLSIDITKASRYLSYKPVWDSANAIQKTIEWYRSYYSGEEALGLCRRDIRSFEVSVG